MFGLTENGTLNILLIFIVLAFLYRIFFTQMVITKAKVKGRVSAAWITRLVFIFYPFIFINPVVETLLFDKSINYVVTFAGLTIYLIGMVLWVWAIKTLNEYWSTDIEIRDEHPLIKNGPYSYLRHPHYLFLFTEVFGIPLIVNAYYSFIFNLVVFVPLIGLRIYFEEKKLIEKFGDSYREYKKEVWGIFPVPVFKKGVSK